MDAKIRLEQTRRKLEETVEKMNELGQVREQLLQEALRLDGERRLLVEMIEVEKKS